MSEEKDADTMTVISEPRSLPAIERWALIHVRHGVMRGAERHMSILVDARSPWAVSDAISRLASEAAASRAFAAGAGVSVDIGIIGVSFVEARGEDLQILGAVPLDLAIAQEREWREWRP